MQGVAAISPLFVYGVKQDVLGGIHFAADGASVVYAAGCGVALFDSGSRTQRLVPLADRERFRLHNSAFIHGPWLYTTYRF